MNQTTQKTTVTMTVNGTKREARCEPMARLLDVLREGMQLTGTKEGCGEGECGACSVILNGRLVNSCLVPVAEAHGASITTIEGLAKGDELHPVQAAFLRTGGAQCGICTPGMILAATPLEMGASLDEIKVALAGNLCRCTGYPAIFRSVESALKTPRRKSSRAGHL